MIELSLDEVARMIGATLVGDGAARITGDVVTDSRLAVQGSLFVALRGESTDGHLFVRAAAELGAVAAIVERPVESSIAQFIVRDSLSALATLAGAVVERVRAKGDLRVIAVTGSNGKTTTKNMLAAALSAVGETVAPVGSFNNDVGAPISMLRITWSTRYLVVEMGADAVGDVARLVAIARPDVGIVLVVGFAHIGKFGSQDAIARAKSEMVTELPETAVAVLNRDDHRVVAMAGLTRATVVWFGLDDAAEVRAEDIETTAAGTSFSLVTATGRIRMTLAILGEHHVMNALAAIAATRAIGVPLETTISSIEAMPRAERWRMERHERSDGVMIINDAYNASPDSMAAALKTLVQVAGRERRSIAVLGEMAELGELADEEHDRIGRLVVRLNISQLVVVGHGARHIHNAAGLEGSWDGESILVDSIDAAEAVLAAFLRSGDVVLVKSSNSAGLRHLGDRLSGSAA